MCGIAGIINYNPIIKNQLTSIVGSMIRTIGHRGPDGNGIWKNEKGNICFGHARLSIIDLSDEGNQPMVSHSQNFIITFNGEIYNYIEIRKELKNSGALFKGTSDTEVLLAAIEKWGIKKAIEKANGMFAFAVLDIKNCKIWFGRDRAGKKPLYIYNDLNQYVFSSEIKGILSVPNINLTISHQAMSNYLSLGFVIGSGTIYNEIKEVSPGALIEFDYMNQSMNEIKYWEFPKQTPLVLSKTEIQSKTENYLKDSIKLRMRADVPVGVFLSGGIDSGLITAIAAKQAGHPIKTFTVGFNEGGFDETKLARQVAKKYSTEHHEILLDPNIEDLLSKVVTAYDEPFADPSAIPTFAIAREASKYVKVVLNGEGSDELFGGYRRTQAIQTLDQLSSLLKILPDKSYDFLIRNFPTPRKSRSAYSFLYRFIRGITENKYNRYINWTMDGFSEDEKKEILLDKYYSKSKQTDQIIRDQMSAYDSLNNISNFMATDFLIGMADCLLPKVDIATMSHGLESRSPFLDYRLIEWVSQINKSSLMSFRKTKPVLRSLGNSYLPQDIVNAPKRGFEIPLVKWMKYDLNAMVKDICMSQDSFLLNFFDKNTIVGLLENRLLLDEERWAKRLWTLFMFALWGKTIDKNSLRIT